MLAISILNRSAIGDEGQRLGAPLTHNRIPRWQSSESAWETPVTMNDRTWSSINTDRVSPTLCETSKYRVYQHKVVNSRQIWHSIISSSAERSKSTLRHLAVYEPIGRSSFELDQWQQNQGVKKRYAHSGLYPCKGLRYLLPSSSPPWSALDGCFTLTSRTSGSGDQVLTVATTSIATLTPRNSD